MQEILRVESLSKEFMIHERNQRLRAFEDVNFVACAGELLALVGASGSGKSSILKCIYRTYLATAGSILYQTSHGGEVDLAQADDAQVLGLRRSEIRFVSQFFKVIPRRSAFQIVENTLREHGKDDLESHDMAKSCLSQVGLPHRLWNLPPNTFSGGEKQLVNFAQALAVRPRLLLLDEPTASLDPVATEMILRVITELKSDDLAMIGVFHDRNIVERLADNSVLLDGGLEVSPEPPKEVL